ncbi:MAG: hypothetical protein J6C34_09545 [Oscillospiraceae bacterium]|nr:hypothetical protein [Oscillospiraceae bacterium]
MLITTYLLNQDTPSNFEIRVRTTPATMKKINQLAGVTSVPGIFQSLKNFQKVGKNQVIISKPSWVIKNHLTRKE